MPVYFIALFSFLIYSAIFFLAWKKRAVFDLSQWPKQPTLFRIWIVWVIFLLLLAPLSYGRSDMAAWQESVEHLLHGERLPGNYVYLPIYGELLAALIWPFRFIGIEAPLFVVYMVNGFVISAYVYCANLMAKFLPEQSELAPLGIVLAPVTIFYLFFGTNHVVMFLLLLAALFFMKRKQWFWAGFFAFFSCYKFLLVPTFLVLVLLIFPKIKRREIGLFVLGGLFFMIPNLIYYSYDYESLARIIRRQAAIGAHSDHIESFHFFFIIAQNAPGFEDWYIDNKIWFYLSLLGVPLSILLYHLKRFNFFQALAFSYALVVILAPEPFRMEPLIGLLWLDAVYREDLKVQTAIFATLFIHAAAWYDEANFAFLVFDPAFPFALWQTKGFLLGLSIIVTFVIILLERDKREMMQFCGMSVLWDA